MTATTFNLADVWEAVADTVPDRTALVYGDRRLTFRDVEDRANRLAHHLAANGIGPGDHVATYMENCTEYVEGMLAAFKLRAVPVNVNYRYVAHELRHLLADAGVKAALVHDRFAPTLAAVASDLPTLDLVIRVPGEYDEALAAASPARDLPPRSSDDHYLMYTGGTTGMPKGVVWRQEDAFFACIGGGDPMRMHGAVERPDQVVERIIDNEFCFLPLAPMMHAAAQWTSFAWLFAGARVVLMPGSLDPDAVWQTIEREKVNMVTMVGDAVGRPLIDAYERAGGGYDTSSLFIISNGGAPLSPTLRERFTAQFPNAILADGFGSSETGSQGAARTTAGEESKAGRFSPIDDQTAVLDENLQPVSPGSGKTGRVARRGHIPLCYLNDPEKTAETFVEAGGRRWVLTGDMARVDEDGTIELLGRSSSCINTGGEKVFTEEVEAALRRHPSVYDVVVVGVPDERWGQAVGAVVQPVPGAEPTLEELAQHCRLFLAGYKVPRSLTLVDRVERSPVGKPDHRWARAAATGEARS
jgi:3-oxocholest-4-en-26-oate---CoA ligase